MHTEDSERWKVVVTDVSFIGYEWEEGGGGNIEGGGGGREISLV